MSDEPLFDWRRDGFSQRTKIEFSMGISDLIKEQINRYLPLPSTKLDALLDECLMKEIDGIEREARAQGAAEERERLASSVEHEVRIPLGGGQNRQTMNYEQYFITGKDLAERLRSNTGEGSTP